MKPQTTQFHLTLAYNFDLSKTDDLSSLAKNIKLDAPVRWELNLYSRNIKFNGKQVCRRYFYSIDFVLVHFSISNPDFGFRTEAAKGFQNFSLEVALLA